MSPKPKFLSPISEQIWDMKYRLKTSEGSPVDQTLADSWRRISDATAKAEKKSKRKYWSDRFYDAISNFQFLPAGRIIAGAGTDRDVTLFNCFVMGTIEDDMGSIFENLREAALTMQQGGGIGHDFSTLRPKGAPVRGVGADASGPVSFMDVWDSMCRTIMSAGSRRGAMMGTMICSHPDIDDFVAAKSDPKRLRMFNLSVLVTDAFIDAVNANADWNLIFDGKVYKTIKARKLWDQIMRSAYDYAEPGVIFIDRVNSMNPLSYCEEIHATNPCGEQPLPPHGACLLGSINLARLIQKPFSDDAALDEKRLQNITATAIRFLDNVIDISRFPLKSQKQEAKAKRRIGLGVTGLADALIMCQQKYGSRGSLKLAERWMGLIEKSAYIASAELAEEKGAFPLFDEQKYIANISGRRLEEEVQNAISTQGLRNGLLTSIAPTGTISLLAGNVSSGVEPVFDFVYKRNVLLANGSKQKQTVEDYAYNQFVSKFGRNVELPPYFVTAQDLSPHDHLAMQAALQSHVDSSISKTINCPEDIPFESFKNVYMEAYDLGLKGCTTYRPNPITGSVLSTMDQAVKPSALSKQHTDSPALGSSQSTTVRRDSDVVYMSEPLERAPVLSGCTYKLKWPDSDHAIYVTINDIVQDERRRPFEIFINSKNLEHYSWTVALTRMISAVFRRGGDVTFVVEELKAVFDPRGGQWMNGRYVPSLLAAIGEIIERHMVNIGFIQVRERNSEENESKEAITGSLQRMRYCPKCSSPALIYQEGCHYCRNCDYSKCS